MAVLVGDVGGTNTRFARLPGPGEREIRVTRPSRGIGDLATAIERFLSQAGPVEAGCLAVAGPVLGGRASVTHLGWQLDAQKISETLGFPLTIINDFHAQALAMPGMEARYLHRLEPSAEGPVGECIAVIGPGTGLGEAILVPDGRGGWRVVVGEGSHARYAPRGEREIGLLRALMGRFGAHVSVERVVSGVGLGTIDGFLRGTEDGDPADITQRALVGSDPVAVEALEIFVAALADEVANLALRCNAGRVFLSGGIPPRILPFLASRFRPWFEEKGRYSAWLRTVPIDVVLHPDPGLVGAAIAAGAIK